MKTFLEFINEDANADWLKNYKTTQQRLAREPTEISKPADYDATRTAYDAAWKKANANKDDISAGANSPFANPNVSSYDPNVSSVAVSPDKPYTSGKFNSALAQAGYDQTGKKVTAIPKQTGVGREKVPLSTNKNNIPSGPGITEPGSAGYTEPVKKKQITDRVPLAADAVVRKKQFNDRVLQVEPPKSQTGKSRGMGPFTISKDDPDSIRYKKVARLSSYAPRTRTKLDKDGTIPAAAQPDKPKKVVRAKKIAQSGAPEKQRKVVTQSKPKDQKYGPITSFIKSLVSPSKKGTKPKFDNRFDPERNK